MQKINGYYWMQDGRLLNDEELAERQTNGFDNLDPLQVIWVNAYRISRHYGGPEEGGWWYDWNTCIASMPISVDLHVEANIEIVKKMMTDALGWEPNEYEQRHGGSRYTVNGHSDFSVYVESSYQASETTEHPHYE